MDIQAATGVLDLARTVKEHAASEDAMDWVARLDARVNDIAPAADAFVAAGAAGDALDLAGALSVFWQDAGRVEQGRRFTESVLSRTDPVQASRERARASLVLGELAFRQGDQPAATDATTSAALLAEQAGEATVLARAELNLARVAFRDGDAERIEHHAKRAQAAAPDDARVRAGATHMLGWAAYTAGDINGAMACFESNVRTYRETGDLIGCASELANLGDLAAEAGDLDAGADYLRQALLVPGVGESSYLAPSLVRSAGVLAAQGGYPADALALFSAADRFYAEFGLVPDPGDDISPAAYEAAVRAVDADAAAQAREQAAGWSLADAVIAAATTLSQPGVAAPG